MIFNEEWNRYKNICKCKLFAELESSKPNNIIEEAGISLYFIKV